MFVTTLFGRNLDDDRPHLGPGLTWLPGVAHGRVRSLVQLIAPYRSSDTVERGIAVTREVYDAVVKLATARGATPLVLVLQVGPEDAVEQALRRRIFDGAGLPGLLVEVDPDVACAGRRASGCARGARHCRCGRVEAQSLGDRHRNDDDGEKFTVAVMIDGHRYAVQQRQLVAPLPHRIERRLIQLRD